MRFGGLVEPGTSWAPADRVPALTFDEIAPIIERTPAAARQLASRSRRRVRDAAPAPDADLAHQRQVLDAFLAAARSGDLEALIAVLDPEVVVRSERGVVGRGVEAVARLLFAGARRAGEARRVLVNGLPGIVGYLDGRPFAITAFTVVGGRIVAIDSIMDAERVRRIAG